MSLFPTFTRRPAAMLAATGLLLGACSGDDAVAPEATFQPQSTSVTPALVKGLPAGVKAYALVGSDDVLPGSPSFRFGGSADGAGFLRNPSGGFTLLLNHEDNFAVSRVNFDDNLRPVSGDYVVNSEWGRWRLCSATLATPEEHGFGPMFLTVGESGIESMIHGVDPFGQPNSSVLLASLGRWNSENAVPLPKTAYPGKTAILIGDDDSGTNGGQVVMYLADQVGDLVNGRLFVLARADNNTRERDMVAGQVYPVEFRALPRNQAAFTGAQLEAAGRQLNMLQLGRVEDLDYRKGDGAAARELYFVTTGQNNTGVNADYGRSKYGRAYRLRLDATDPTKGTLEVILDGDDRAGPARQFQNPDNVYVGRNYVYLQEDPNGYGDETHDSYIYQYNIATREVKVVMELDHRRTESDAATYNVGGPSRFGSWEYGAMIDVSDHLGIPDAFLIAIQPHTWRDDRFLSVAGRHPQLPNENQGSQMILVTGLPR